MAHVDTDWTPGTNGSESRWCSGFLLEITPHGSVASDWQWTVTDGEPDGQPCERAELTRLGKDVAKRRAVEAAEDLAWERAA